MNFTKKIKNKKIHGFAMLEVFIALLVVTVIVSTATLSGITINNYEKRKTTRTRMQYIQKALNQYLVTYGRLPCPADPTSQTSASETLISSVCSSSLSFNSGNTYYGAVPTDTLNISREYLQDGWSNKILYVVPRDLTYSNSSIRTAIYYKSSTTGLYEINGVSSGSASYTTTNFANYIIMYYNNGVSDIQISNRNIYALLSHGENSLGAYTIAGTRNSSSGANSTNGELSNIITSAKANNIIYTNQSSNSIGKLDDIVYPTSVSDVISNNDSLILCDSNTRPDGSTLVPTPTALPHYSPSSLVQFSQNCGTCPTVSGTRNYVECLSGGNWSAMISRACTC